MSFFILPRYTFNIFSFLLIDKARTNRVKYINVKGRLKGG